ncbi:MAG: hypothetical protein VB674_04700 [Vicinamibacterales bacterium]
MKVRFPSWSWIVALTVTAACATPVAEMPSPIAGLHPTGFELYSTYQIDRR